MSEMTLVTGGLQDEEDKWWVGGHTTIQQYVGVQFQINPNTLLFETNYMRQFANIEVITLVILTSDLKVFFLLFICFLYLFWKSGVRLTKFKIPIKYRNNGYFSS